MKKYISLILMSFLVAACNGGTKKIKDLSYFTLKLKQDSSEKIVLSGEVANSVPNDLLYGEYVRAQMKLQNLPNQKQQFSKIKLTDGKLLSAPYVTDGKIYAVDNKGNVSCTDVSAGKSLWKKLVASDKSILSASSLTYSAGKLYVIADLEIHILDAASGREIARKTLKDLVRAYPAVKSNALFIKNISNQLTAYNLDVWKEAWSSETWQESIMTSNYSSPVFFGGGIITNFSTGQIVFSKMENGEEIWQINLSKDSASSSSDTPQNLTTLPVLYGENLFVASNNGSLINIHIPTATVVWKKEYQDIISMNAAGNALYVTNNARQLAAISLKDGTVMWVSDIEQNDKKKKSVKAPVTSFLTPLIADEKIIIFSKEKMAYVFDAKTGLYNSEFKTPNPVLFYSIDAGNLIIFDEKSAYKIK